jgi:hypothetical protein
MTGAAQLAASPKTFAERDAWLRGVVRADLPDAAVRVAVCIGLHLRIRDQRCDPSYSRLAVESHLAERSVIRIVSLLEHKGWIGIQRTRGRRSNQYVLLNHAKAESGLSAPNPAKAESGLKPANHDSRRDPTMTQTGSNHDSAMSYEQRNNEEEQREESDSAADLFSPDRDEPDATTKPKRKPKPTRAEIGELFERFWSLYPRQIARAAAFKAYASAVKSGADPNIINAACERFALAERARIEREGGPQFTPYPQRWLRERRFNDAPPAGAVVLDQDGNVVAEQPQQQGRPKSFQNYADQAAEDGDTWLG